MNRIPRELAVVPALALVRLLPDSGVGLYLKLAAATLVVLLPGVLLARLLGRPSVSSTLAWSLTGIAVAGGFMFAVHGSLNLAIALYAAFGAVVLVLVVRNRPPRWRYWPAAAIAAGALFGILLWHVAGGLGGDALFHLARVRKLEAFGDLHLRTLDEFKDGGLHPGYAFPLWHLLLAFVARLGGVDPAKVVLHEASLLCPLAFAVVYEAGRTVFRSRSAALAVVVANLSVIALAPGKGGAFIHLALPATAARQLLVPAVIALFFQFVGSPSRVLGATLAASGLALALVHPTYALFLAIPLAGYVGARALLVRAEWRRGLLAVGALLAPAAAVSLWLLPIVRETAAHNPSDRVLRNYFVQYRNQLVVYSLHSYRMAAEVFSRTGAVAVAALVSVPLAYFARRRRWAALVLGGTVVIALLTLVPLFFSTFSDIVSLSQARRVVGFLPFAFAFAGGAAVLSRLLGPLVLPLALAAGIALQLLYPGDFGYHVEDGGPALAAWIAAAGGTAALVLGILRRGGGLGRPGHLTGLAALLFVLPVAIAGFADWSAPASPPGLTPGLVAALKRYVPKGDVVFTDPATGYRIAAAAPVYVNTSAQGHVADTKPNHPAKRRADAAEFLKTRDIAIPVRYGAHWIVVLRSPTAPTLDLERPYEDAKYALYRLSGWSSYPGKATRPRKQRR